MRIRDIPLICVAFLCWVAFVGPSLATDRQITASEIMHITSTLATSSETTAQTKALRLVCSTDCYVSIEISGIDTDGATTPVFLPANETLETRIVGRKLVVVTASGTASGILSITELSE